MTKKRTLLYEVVVDFVKSRIADGTYLPGQRLPSVSDLANEIEVGVSTIREGIRVLANLGLVRVHQGQGMFITEDARLAENPQEALALAEDAFLLAVLEVRRIFESEIAALAAERANPDQIQAILQAAAEQERQARRSGDPIPSEFGFHRLILDAAQNPVLTKMMRSVEDELLDVRRRTIHIFQSPEHSVHYHYLIAHAIETRDPDQARVLMSQHVLNLTNAVKIYLQQSCQHGS